eukprot:12639039-Alexandrium_andersonii.AAC.1
MRLGRIRPSVGGVNRALAPRGRPPLPQPRDPCQGVPAHSPADSPRPPPLAPTGRSTRGHRQGG